MYSIYTFCITLLFWIVLSGRFDYFHLSLGLVSSLLITILSKDLLFRESSGKRVLPDLLRFVVYLPWLIREMFLSGIHVTGIVFHPKMMERINPRIITFKTKLKREISRVAFANSITLTPGTITVRMQDDEFQVHALTDKVAAGLPGEMEDRISKVFQDE